MRLRAVAFVVLGLLAACGSQTETVEIPPDELPFPVARSSSPTETTAPPRTVTVYFVRSGRLVPRQRQVAADLPRSEAAIRALLDGPTPEEMGAGIRSELPDPVRLLTLADAEGTAAVDLSGEFQEPAPPERISLRVAQVTWTLTEIPGISSVAFAIDGEAVSVSTDDGTTVDRPVRRSDYAVFAPIG